MLKFTLKSYHTLTILFLLNITTNIIYAQTQTSPPNQATNIQPPIDLQWSGSSGSVDIEIYECSVDANAPIGTIDLGGYELLSGPIDIPVSGNDDLSGITYNPLTNTLFMVINGAAIAYETTLTGTVLRNITLNGFDDTEGIVHLGGTQYAVTEERRGRITFFDITSSTNIVNYNSNASYVQLPGSWNNNQGLEGVSFSPGTNNMYVVKEKTPKAYYEFPFPNSLPQVLSTISEPCDLQLNPFNFGDVSGMHHLGINAGFSQIDVNEHLLILSHESLALIETDPSCGEVSRLNLAAGGANGTIPTSLSQPEGVTMDNNGVLYIVSEPNDLYIFTNPNLNLNPTTLGTPVYNTTTTGSSHSVPFNSLEEGVEYCWRINDGSGWTNYSSFTVAPIINIPPTVSITTPTDGTVYNSAGITTVSAAAADIDGTVSNVEFYVDGVSLGSDNTVPYQVNYIITNGTHTITAIATDNDGNQTTSAPVTITANIVNIPPNVMITSPSDGLVLGSFATVNIIAAASDIDGSIAQVEFFINGNSIGTDNAPTYSITYDLLIDGIYTIVAVSTDNEGLTSSDTITVRLGPNAPPRVNLVSPLNDTLMTSFSTRTIRAHASDPDQGGSIAQVEFFLNGSLYVTDDTPPYEFDHVFDANGDYFISAIATDNEGATQLDGPITMTVEVDNFPPTTQITSPADATTFLPSEIITITTNAEDSDGDIQHVEFFIDGLSYEIDDQYPYMVQWSPGTPGTYTITAIATDDDGVESISSEITINIEYGQTFTTNSSISNGNDDVEEQSDGEMYFNSTDLELMYDNNRGNQNAIGLRFNSLNIPQGATILNAYLQFRSDEIDSGSTNVSITGEASDNAAAFTSASSNLTMRPMTSASVAWAIPTWGSINAVTAAQRSPNITPVIQEIVSRSGFGTNSSIVISISGTGQRVADSYEGSVTNAPKLVVEYTMSNCPPAGLACDDNDTNTDSDLTDGSCGCAGTPTSITGLYLNIPITSGDDDVEENGLNGNMYMYSSDLEMAYDRTYTGNQHIGLRFDGVFLPANATITAAHIQFTVDETKNNAGTLSIHGESSGNAAAFVNTPYNVSSRAQTNASTSWTPAPWTMVGMATQDQQTPDISAIVQEILSTPGWSANNAMAFIIQGTGKRVAESYEGSETMAPVLHIEYIVNFTSGDDNETNLTSEDIETPEVNDREPFTFKAYQTQHIQIFPNPADYEVNISLDLDGIDADKGTVSLFNLNGQLMMQESFNPQTEQALDLDIEQLTSGSYLIQIQAGDYSTTQKLIKK